VLPDGNCSVRDMLLQNSCLTNCLSLLLSQ
jgi:hypothetical protein